MTTSRAGALATELCARAGAAIGRAAALCDESFAGVPDRRRRRLRSAFLREVRRLPLAADPEVGPARAARARPRPVAETPNRDEARAVRQPTRRAAAAERSVQPAEGDADWHSWAGAALYGVRRIGTEGSPGSWTVREIDAAGQVRAPSGRCLVFESDWVVRRVWCYPASWADLDDEALLRVADLRIRRD